MVVLTIYTVSSFKSSSQSSADASVSKASIDQVSANTHIKPFSSSTNCKIGELNLSCTIISDILFSSLVLFKVIHIQSHVLFIKSIVLFENEVSAETLDRAIDAHNQAESKLLFIDIFCFIMIVKILSKLYIKL
ncbi:hypothetical protein HOF65_07025 [bacterium]|nr:hypothetical protein [bacterium]MBT3853670.1 hypothetical protein [bacterium]MBT4633034.1 hypothetical protein [bacterium]MBT5491981.1 hypothetical protein [bacterium]MBT6778386.1 hypothetical protein [bacterium]